MHNRAKRIALVIATTIAIGGYVIASSSPAQAAASLTVTPNTGLSDGQIVNVSGTGFNPNAPVVIRECKPGPTCKNIGAASTDATGGFSTNVPVVTDISSGVSCLPANDCFVQARDTSGAIHTARQAIRFGGSGSTTTTTPPSGAPCDNPTIKGTAGDDTLTGTTGKDVIAGVGGRDTINALGGDDVICGGKDNDVINGGAGNDRIFGNDGDDTIDGGAGTDRCSGGLGTGDTAKNCETTNSVP